MPSITGLATKAKEVKVKAKVLASLADKTDTSPKIARTKAKDPRAISAENKGT